jgi:gamma-glutamyl hercynylcysteine S-oxide synthase
VPLADDVTLPLGGVESLPADRLAAQLVEARRRTLALVSPLELEQIDRQFSPIMSPLAWDLGHIAAFADLWTARALPGGEPLRPDLFEVYDATETPRSGRGDLPYLRCEEAIAYGWDVLERTLAAIERAGSTGDDPLTAGDFVWHMILQHEHQHNETMVQAMQLAAGEFPAPLGVALAGHGTRGEASAVARDTVRVPAGPARVGVEGEAFAYDNERPARAVELGAFELDRCPVTNGAYREWVEAGGYRRPEWWSSEGWAWRERERVERPLFWTEDGRERRFDRTEPLAPDLPVAHVSWHEADAFARAHGRRLPTETEWERAATWDAHAARARAFPWGDETPTADRANIDLRAGGPLPAGTLPGGASERGVLGLTGDVWEWTASEFGGYPGFRAFPYREYSEVFFGKGLRVLRGGSFATRPTIARPTFRNWDLPERRQIFAGFRLARDA